MSVDRAAGLRFISLAAAALWAGQAAAGPEAPADPAKRLACETPDEIPGPDRGLGVSWSPLRAERALRMHPRIFFVTGVVGAGKTSLVEPLRAHLGPAYEVHDFDERGVPDDVDMDWGAAERKHWVSVGMAKLRDGIGTVICGFALPSGDDDRDLVKLILLDLNEGTLRRRLMKRYSDPANVEALTRMRRMTVEESVRENVGSIAWLRDLCSAHGAEIIDTSEMTPDETAEQVAHSIRRQS